ncbi:hypothetical protein ACFL4W_00205 [Planctomycetota bacterium]
MIELKTKENWPEAQERFKRWWAREATDRPVTIVTCPREKPLTDASPPPEAETPEQRWKDLDDIIARKKDHFARCEYMGEAFPWLHPALGPGALGAYLGAKPEFSQNTVWYEKCYDSPKEANAILDENNEWWQWNLDYTQRIIDACEGDYIPAFPDLIENMDTVAQLLGTLESVYAVGDQPDDIKRLQDETLASFVQVYNTMHDMMYTADSGSVFMGFDIWSPGRCLKMQCDIAALLSPDIFSEFVAPWFVKQCEQVDHVLYHLDGPDAIYSLDSLLEIEGINAIQWVPGAGNAPAEDDSWDFIYKKILDAGKGIWAFMPPATARGFKKKFGSTGVYLSVGWIDSRDDARELLADLAK